MNHIYKLFFLSFLMPLITYSQSNYRPGYIIKPAGDTIRGLIDVREWNNTPRNINFKAEPDAQVQNCSVETIKGFGVGPFVFRAFVTKVSTDQTSGSSIAVGRDTSSRNDNIFLEVKQAGYNVTLYSYTDAIKTRFYVADNSTGNPVELIYRVYKQPDHIIIEESQNAYMGQLFNLAQKYHTANEGFQQQIEAARYNMEDLEKIIKKINNNVIIPVGITNKQKQSSVGFYLGAAYQNVMFKPSGMFPVYNFKNYNTSVPLFDVGLNLYPNPRTKTVVVKLEFAYFSDKYNTTANAYYDERDHSSFSLKQSVFAVYPQVLYNIYNADNFKLYLDAGLAVNFSSYSNNVFYNAYNNATDSPFLGLNKIWFSLPVKVGVAAFKNLDIYVSYSYAQSLTSNATGSGSNGNSNNYSLNVSSIRVGINYIFGL